MSPILGTMIGPIFEMGGKIIDKIFPDKTLQEKERAQAQLALAQLMQSGDLETMKASLSAIIAEAQSNDPWTSRARPSFLYVMYIMILTAIPMGILFAFIPEKAEAITTGVKMWLTAIPDELYMLFGVGYLGYTGARSFDYRSKRVSK